MRPSGLFGQKAGLGHLSSARYWQMGVGVSHSEPHCPRGTPEIGDTCGGHSGTAPSIKWVGARHSGQPPAVLGRPPRGAGPWQGHAPCS